MDREAIKSLLDTAATRTCKAWKVSKSERARIELKCKNRNCNWKIGFYMSPNGWRRIRGWREIHADGCLYAGNSDMITSLKRKKAISIIAAYKTLTKADSMLHARILAKMTRELTNRERMQIQNTAYYYRKKYGMTRSQRREKL